MRLSILLSSVLATFSCVSSTDKPLAEDPPKLANPHTRSVAPDNPELVIQRIALGSCNKQDLPQPYWSAVAAKKPDLWIWAGDNVYADTEDPEQMHATYEKQLKVAEYQKFLNSIPIIGTWDDHDFGVNNGGQEYPSRKSSQSLFLDFIGEAEDSPRRKQQGIYTSYVFGRGQKQLKIFLLDARYHREKPGPQADILGEEQWQWLAKELAESQAKLHIFVSGIQFVPIDHRFEKWQEFPKTRQRFLKLLKEYPQRPSVFLSGDRHLSEISVLPQAQSGLAYEFAELTSSGLTHSYSSFQSEENRFRIGQVYPEKSFGMVSIQWTDSSPRVTLSIHAIDGKPVQEHRLEFEPQ